MAARLAEGIRAKGYEFVIPPQTNIYLPASKPLVEELSKKVMFETGLQVTETHQAIRLVTSWGTKEEEIDAFLGAYLNFVLFSQTFSRHVFNINHNTSGLFPHLFYIIHPAS